MEEVIRNLFIGSVSDSERIRGRPGWAIVHAERAVYREYVEKHRLPARDAVASPDGSELFLSFEDASGTDRVNTRCILPALGFIHRHLSAGRKVLIHCVAGMSRAPAIVLLYLLRFTNVLPRTNIFDAIFSFSEIYPLYDLNDGLLQYSAGFLEEMRGTVRLR
ncbi:MAG TPA: dual specificity protein phosphatase family protein [Methanomicrobiales archaeon]|jgi:hypothetical protein|nr:dual specificity protein phosphatase family protein [Methanomicrobiales archaeon]